MLKNVFKNMYKKYWSNGWKNVKITVEKYKKVKIMVDEMYKMCMKM